MHTALTLLVIAASVGMIARRVDVRLALGLGALPLFMLAGKTSSYLGFFAREMANPATIVPIGSAMGFSYVLRLTGCEVHLIELLLRPLRRVRALLVPGGIAAGYLVNTTLVSQTSAAAVLGPILIPLLRAGHVPAATAGAVLLLGCSMGGELFNPGAVEVVTLSGLVKSPPTRVVESVAPWNLLASGCALAVFWWLELRPGGRGTPHLSTSEATSSAASEALRINPLKAGVPLVPLVLLFAGPRLLGLPRLVTLPEADFPKLSEPASILVAMLLGVVAAVATSPRAAGRVAAAFFEGAGYAYVHVISLIVTATVFAEGARASGLIDELAQALAGRRPLAVAVAIALPLALARICGSGIAPAVASMRAFVPRAGALAIDPVQLGAISAVAAHFGRTMSPAAAVVALTATLAGAERDDILRRVAPPLLAGLLVLMLAAWLR